MEKLLFYPKLASAYRKLNLSENLTTGVDLTVFDVGANKGQSIMFFKTIYPQSKIFAFEPSKKILNFLKEFVENMQYGDVSIFQTGIGDIQATIDFYESSLDETSSFVLPNQNSRYLRKKNRILFQKNKDAFQVGKAQITTLDKFIEEKEVTRVDILKIDVEGFEFEVLLGARKSLTRGKFGVIQLERHSNDMRDDRYPFICELLLSHGYKQIQEIKHPFWNLHEILFQWDEGAFRNL
jgi:FkbM family methyltransferase